MQNGVPPGRSRARVRRVLTAAVLTVAAVITPLTVSSPASAAFDCTPPGAGPLVPVGDMSVRVCWDWVWINPTSTWRPTALYVDPDSADSTKTYYLRIDTNAINTPQHVYLGAKRGFASFGVPDSYSWNMESGVESTTVTIARVIPGRDKACVGWFRHDRSDLYLLRHTGSC